MTRVATTTLLAVMLTGCAATVPLELDFPSETAVLISSNADIFLIPVTADELDRCPELLRTPSITEGVEVDSVPVCDLRSYSLPDPGGPAAILVRVLDDMNATILEGCTIADVYPGRGEVTIELYPTSAYTTRLERDPPAPGASIELRCGGS